MYIKFQCRKQIIDWQDLVAKGGVDHKDTPRNFLG